jgi:trans-aconitate methyltransferase
MTWNSILYDSKHHFVSRLSEDLVSEWLKPQVGERILDLGCGTGYLTQKIADSGAAAVGLDASPEMIERAWAQYPHLEFIVADATNFRFDQPFDGVFSNAALHWIHEAASVVECVYDALKPGGRFVTEFGCKGNVATVVKATEEALRENSYPALTRPPWYFPSLGEYTSLLEQQGFFVAQAVQFDRPTPLEGEEGGRNWIHMFGAPLMPTVPDDQRQAFMTDLEKRIRPTLYRDGQWFMDYRRLRILAIK